MHRRTANMVYFLLPLVPLIILMVVALVQYPMLYNRAIQKVITVFAAVVLYVVLWTLLQPNAFSKKAGALVGFLFIVNISLEEFIDWQTKTAILIFTLSMMFLIFVSFSIASGITTAKTGSILQGIKSSFSAALFGTIIALCFGFFIDFAFPARMAEALNGYPGYNSYRDPHAFTFYNSFDNAASHVIIAPAVSVIMGTLGAALVLLIQQIKKGSKREQGKANTK